MVFQYFCSNTKGTCCKKPTIMVDDDVGGLSGGVGANHAGDRHDLADEGVLLLRNVYHNIGLVPITACTQRDVS